MVVSFVDYYIYESYNFMSPSTYSIIILIYLHYCTAYYYRLPSIPFYTPPPLLRDVCVFFFRARPTGTWGSHCSGFGHPCDMHTPKEHEIYIDEIGVESRGYIGSRASLANKARRRWFLFRICNRWNRCMKQLFAPIASADRSRNTIVCLI
jgi:hypothetical protein